MFFSRFCSFLSKYLPILLKQRKEQSHAQCHVKHPIRTFDKVSEHVTIPKFHYRLILLSERVPLHVINLITLLTINFGPCHLFHLPPKVHLVGNIPPTRMHILLLYKNISPIRESYMIESTLRNVSTPQLFGHFRQKNYHLIIF